MAAESCEEIELKASDEQWLRTEMEVLELFFKNAFTMYEKSEELKRNPPLWISLMEKNRDRALCLFEHRKEHPKLRMLFATLEEALQKAEDRLEDRRSRKIRGFV